MGNIIKFPHQPSGGDEHPSKKSQPVFSRDALRDMRAERAGLLEHTQLVEAIAGIESITGPLLEADPAARGHRDFRVEGFRTELRSGDPLRQEAVIKLARRCTEEQARAQPGTYAALTQALNEYLAPGPHLLPNDATESHPE